MRIYGRQEQRFSSNVRGKNRAGLRSFGTNWVECDRCGSSILSSDAKVQWNGLVCCPDHWDAKHSGDMPQPTPSTDRPPELVRHSGVIRFRDGTEIRAGQSSVTAQVISDILIVSSNQDYLQVDAAQPNDYLSWE